MLIPPHNDQGYGAQRPKLSTANLWVRAPDSPASAYPTPWGAILWAQVPKASDRFFETKYSPIKTLDDLPRKSS
jgi:hypothetical protein